MVDLNNRLDGLSKKLQKLDKINRIGNCTPSARMGNLDINGERMKMIIRLLILTLFLTMMPTSADLAVSLNQSRRIIGIVDRLVEINRQRVVENVDPDTVGLPTKFIIDLQRRTMRGAPDSLVRRLASVENITRTANALILQGTDEGMPGDTGVFGWSLVIDTATGKAVLSASGSGIAYVAFGSCTPSSAVGEKGSDDTAGK